MAFTSHKDLYDPKNVPQFQKEVCNKTCHLKGQCIKDGQDTHWFLMCPLYHKWKIGYTSFVFEQIQWEREHPEEAAQKHKERVERAKAWGDEQRRLKREAKAKEKAEKIAKGEIEEKSKKTRTKKTK